MGDCLRKNTTPCTFWLSAEKTLELEKHEPMYLINVGKIMYACSMLILAKLYVYYNAKCKAMQPREISTTSYQRGCIKNKWSINVAWCTFNISLHESLINNKKIEENNQKSWKLLNGHKRV